MEEVDSIIIEFLTQLNINCTDVTCLTDMPVNVIVEAVSKCLNTICPDLNAPSKLPSGVSQKIEVASQIAYMCKDLGYKNDVGYQTFLYCNENDLRQVFMFLIEKLPNDRKAHTVPVSDAKHSLLPLISKNIEDEMNMIWKPHCCYTNNRRNSASFNSVDLDKQYALEYVNLIKNLDNSSEDNEIIINNIKPDSQNNEIVSANFIEKSLKELRETVSMLKHKLTNLETDQKQMESEYREAKTKHENAESELKNIKNILRDIGIQNSSMDSTDNIIEKANKNIDSLHMKSEELTSRNLALKFEIEKFKSSHSMPEPERDKCRKILLDLKETAKRMKQEYQNKEALKVELKKKYEKLKDGNKRSVYTKRIMEIIANVDKQNIDIAKILEDTRELQKEINSLEGQLDRCFSVADETFFKDAKKDDQAKKAYKLLALLHSECNTIVTLINDTGTLSREIVDLEDNIKAEKAKRTEDTLAKIQSDMNMMHQEYRVGTP